MLDMLKTHAYAIRNLPVPSAQKPAPAPVLLFKGSGFTWRGSSGAAFYTIERTESENGTWVVIATGLDDSVIADVANFEPTPKASEALVLFYDESKVNGKTYFYRIKGVNAGGESEYSNVLKVN